MPTPSSSARGFAGRLAQAAKRAARSVVPAIRRIARKEGQKVGVEVTVTPTERGDFYGAYIEAIRSGKIMEMRFSRFGSFDMKPGILAGRTQMKRNKKGEMKPKINKDGQPYFDIPLHLNKPSGHASGIVARSYEGEPRREDRGGAVIFRRVSANSSPGKWIHPGFQAGDILGNTKEGAVGQLMRRVRQQAEVAFSDALKKDRMFSVALKREGLG